LKQYLDKKNSSSPNDVKSRNVVTSQNQTFLDLTSFRRLWFAEMVLLCAYATDWYRYDKLISRRRRGHV